MAGFSNWDFSLLKDVEVGEAQRRQLRFEAFNFSNQPSRYSPGGNARNDNNFGRIFCAKTMRELQFGVKYIF